MRILLPILLWLAAPGVVVADTAPSEYELKAALLYRLAKFIEWPENALNSATFNVCVVGNEPPDAPFSALHGKQVHDRPIRVTIVRNDDQILTGCHVAFLADKERPSLRRVLSRLDDHPTLTVSDRPGFASIGGVINFVTQKDRLRFEINREQGERQGLRVHSQLLALATIVKSADGG